MRADAGARAENGLDSLLHGVYGVVGSTDEGRWREMLASVTQFVRSKTAVLEFVGRDAGGPRYIAAGARSDRQAITEWESRAPEDAIPLPDAPGRMMVCNDYSGMSVPARFAALLDRYGVSRSASCALGVAGGGRMLLHAARSSEQPPFDADAQARMGSVGAHLQRAMAMHFERMEAVSAGFADAADAVDTGVICIDRDATILSMNACARRLCGEGLLRRVGERLTAGDPGDAARLGRMIARLSESAAGSTEAMRLTGNDARSATLLASVATVEIAPFRNFRRHIRIWVQAWPTGGGDLAPALASLFGLTRAEARIAQLVAEGVEMADIPQRLGIRPSTLRYHRESIYAKLAVPSKSAMVALLASTVPLLHRVRDTIHSPPGRG